MSAPDKAPPETISVVCYDGLPGPLGNVAYPDLRHTVEIYHHDRVVQDLRRRLDKMVHELERILLLDLEGSPVSDETDKELQQRYRDPIKAAITAAKGGE